MYDYTIQVHYNFYCNAIDEMFHIEMPTKEPTAKDIFEALKNTKCNVNDVEYLGSLYKGHVETISYKA